MAKEKASRREFLKTGWIAIATVIPTLDRAEGRTPQSAKVNRHAIFAALGDTIIPTDPDDPGYRTLEPYGITEEVMKGLEAIRDAYLEIFNAASADLFGGKSFLELTEVQRADYLKLIIAGSRFKDKAQLRILQMVYRQTRTRVFTVFYQNFPENVIPSDESADPNSEKLVTGWDIVGFKGPLTREEEEARREKFKKIGWHE